MRQQRHTHTSTCHHKSRTNSGATNKHDRVMLRHHGVQKVCQTGRLCRWHKHRVHGLWSSMLTTLCGVRALPGREQVPWSVRALPTEQNGPF